MSKSSSAARLRSKVKDLKRILSLATADCGENWQRFAHEVDCLQDFDCHCDGPYIVEQVAKALGKRIQNADA